MYNIEEIAASYLLEFFRRHLSEWEKLGVSVENKDVVL